MIHQKTINFQPATSNAQWQAQRDEIKGWELNVESWMFFGGVQP